MNYAKIKKHDISNGPGVRVSLYVSGCTHHCKNCFNPETWDFSFGEPFDQSAETEISRRWSRRISKVFLSWEANPLNRRTGRNWRIS